MSEIENKPVDAPVAEAPAAETAPAADADVDTKVPTDVVKKVGDKKSMLAKLKAIIKKVLPGKKEKAIPTTTEEQPEDAAPVEAAPPAAPTTTAAA